MNAAKVQLAIHDLYSGVLDLLYPPCCLVCSTLGEDILCEKCKTDLIVPVPPPYCIRCGQVQAGEECFKCADYPAELVRCRAVGVHEGQLAGVVHALKYRERPMLARPLAGLMAEYLTIRAEIMHDLKFDAIVPVPLHKSRERKRGYNQSERLARELGLLLNVPLESRALTRVVNTSPQVGKHRSERLKNLTKAFRADSRYCQGKAILLLDDVSTTGSTICECARELADAGAVAIYAITLAAG